MADDNNTRRKIRKPDPPADALPPERRRPPKQAPTGERDRHRRTDDDGQVRRRYLVAINKIDAADRDVSGPVLRGRHAGYRDIMNSDDDPAVDIGAPVAFDAWLTDEEAAAFAAASNVRSIEQDWNVPQAFATLPSTASLAWMNASLAQQGSLNGAGVKVAVLDGGTTAAVRAQCSWTVAVSKIFPVGGPPVSGGHGCLVSPMIVPPAGQLVEGMIDSGGSAAWSDMAAGVVWACDQGAQVINISYGTDAAGSPGALTPTVVDDAFGYARDRGVQVCVAAGNESAGLSAPSISTRAFPNVHAIGAIDKSTSGIASFSNRDPDLSGVAPGVNEPSLATDGTAVNWSGTSCASPQAGGLIALLCTGGTYSPQQAADALKVTARDLGLGVAVQGRGAWSLSHAKAALAAGIPTGGLMRASRSSNQVIPNAANTRIAFDTIETTDSNVSANTAKDVFTLLTAGEYEVTAAFRWGGSGGSAPGDRVVHIGPNIPWDAPGGKMWAPWSEKGSASPLMDTISTTIKVAAGQQLCVWAWQNCGGGWTMEYAAAHPDNRLLSLAIKYLGT